MIEGIDVSHWQGFIDWEAVAEAGIRFAIIKATGGGSFVDHCFGRNKLGAQKAGIVAGAYHFWRPRPSGTQQAEHFLRHLGDPTGMLIPALDVERYATVPKAEVTRSALEWLRRVERELGVKPLVYANVWWCKHKLGAEIAQEGYPLWLAYWRPWPPKVSQARPLGGWTSWAIWQYYARGRVPGIRGHVDRDRLAGDLRAYVIGGGYQPGPVRVILLPDNAVIDCRARLEGDVVRCELRTLAERLGYEVHDHIPDQRRVYLRRRTEQ